MDHDDAIGPGSEQRWDQALSLLDGTPDAGTRRRVRRQRRVLVTGVVGGLLAATTAGVLAGALFTSPHHQHAGRGVAVPGWREALGVFLTAAGVVLVVVGIVGLVRAGPWGPRWRSPTAMLTPAQRRALYRQVAGRQPVEAARLPLARHLASRLVRQRPLLVLLAGQVPVQLGTAVTTAGSTWRIVLAASVSGLFALAAALVERDARRGRRFLAQHPEPGPAGPTEVPR